MGIGAAPPARGRARRSVRAVAALVMVVLGLAACSGRAYQATPPSPPPTPVLVPSEVPVETPSVEPTEGGTGIPPPLPGNEPGTIPVYGTIRAKIVPVEVGRATDSGPSIITMTWSAPATAGSEVHQVAQDVSTGDFRMVLSPFDLYGLAEVELTGGSFGFEATGLPTNGPNGTDPVVSVPGSGCVYVGRMTFTYFLLPPGDSLTQLSQGSELARGRSLSIFFTSAGTFVYLPDDASSHVIDLPPAAKRAREARGCAVSRAEFRDLGS